VTAQPSAPQIRAYRKFGRSEPAGRESRKLAHNLSEAVAVSNRVVVMTSTPARIVAIIPIDLPRPRAIRELQKNPHFHELYAQL